MIKMVSGVVKHHVSMRRLAEVGRSVEARLHRRLQVDGWVERARQLGKSCGAGARADVEQRAQQALDEALARADAVPTCPPCRSRSMLTRSIRPRTNASAAVIPCSVDALSAGSTSWLPKELYGREGICAGILCCAHRSASPSTTTRSSSSLCAAGRTTAGWHMKPAPAQCGELSCEPGGSAQTSSRRP